ncbi:MAG TPA: hypothetical protein VF411_05590, partial [Bacteroidia bacterium]
MKSTISFCNLFTWGIKFFSLTLVLLPALAQAQSTHIPNHAKLQAYTHQVSSQNLKTASTGTCPVNPTMIGQDTLGNIVTNGQTLACGAFPFFIQPANTNTTVPNMPCIETVFTNYHNNMALQGTETFIQGGVAVYTICPTCPNTIGGGNLATIP